MPKLNNFFRANQRYPPIMSKFLISRPGHVYLAAYDASANTFTITYDLALPGCLSWLAVDRPRSLLYVVDEDSSKFHRFRLDLDSATPFTHHETVDTASPGAVYLAFSCDARRLLCAAFASGNVDVWDVSDGIALERCLDKTVVSDGRPGPLSHIQDAPHPHQVLLDPTGRFYVVPDLGTDELLVIDSQDDAFAISSRVAVGPPGSGPRHGAFYPVGAATPSHYILLCELANIVVVYALHYTGSTLEFTRVSETCTFGPGGPSVATARAGHLALLPDNKHILLTNRLTGRAHDSVAYMRVHDGGEHPVLEFVQEVPTLGLRPRMFCLMDDGRGAILVANEQSEFGVVVLARTPDGRIEKTPKLCVRMSEFMDQAEMVEHPGNGPKFIMQV
ncbi:Lactonase, 7-bladed beta propeller [Cordyceps fumosorosea ARSEF 2679]|uniref:Lactonase, 7-bladed beta propeller n=1 Tax=Cordyceps fumosorosea (strain ARSEF 2679) TaxID=1081104 RepID=A0A167EAD7_CORFA|nr:Lactonase, 7-bladed beta propeller [Cordyceps fumosorosea ARSEF 2679]OAA43577.1 Lactonase, 7-bladed beta propeller [Cordyceps fumosorosea ARSEF 2679]